MVTDSNLLQKSFSRTPRNKVAFIEPLEWDEKQITKERQWTFGEFIDLIQSYRKNLDKENFQAGHRVLFVIDLRVETYALLSALFANGVVPVFVERELFAKNLNFILSKIKPFAIFSTHQFFRYRWIIPQLWKSRLYSFNENGLFMRDWQKINGSLMPESSLAVIKDDQESLITFTSGTTQQPKAANREHSIVYHQREISRNLWPQTEGGIEITAFPLAIFNNLVSEITTVLPVSNDASASTYWLQQIKNHKVDSIVGPPSVFNTLLNHPQLEENSFQSIKRTATGGAPVPLWLIKKIEKHFHSSQNFNLYGSTEAEPISFIPFKDILKIYTKGSGYLVGKPIDEIQLKVISPLSALDAEEDQPPQDLNALPPSQSGEVIVAGPHVIKEYYFNPKENKKTKIKDSQGNIWHRTRDTGFLDIHGHLYLTGRLQDRLSVGSELIDVYPIEHDLENLLETRVALVEGSEGFCLCVETGSLTQRDFDVEKIKSRLSEENIQISIKYYPRLPVDPRHYWKIDRTQLKSNLN